MELKGNAAFPQGTPQGIVMKKMIGLAAFLIAIGMLIMLIAHNRLTGLIIIAVLLFVGYHCFCGD